MLQKVMSLFTACIRSLISLVPVCCLINTTWFQTRYQRHQSECSKDKDFCHRTFIKINVTLHVIFICFICLLSPLPPSPSHPSLLYTSSMYNAWHRDPNNYWIPSKQRGTCALYLNRNEAESKAKKIHCGVFFLLHSLYNVKLKPVFRSTVPLLNCLALFWSIKYTAFVKLQCASNSYVIQLWRIYLPCFNLWPRTEDSCFGALMNCIALMCVCVGFFLLTLSFEFQDKWKYGLCFIFFK